MFIDELEKDLNIAPEIHDIVEEVFDLTGKNIDIQLVSKMNVDGSTKIAREGMPNHIVKIKTDQKNRFNHLLAHECGHIIRIMSVDAKKRVVPASNRENIENAKKSIGQQMLAIPEAMREKALDFWTNGIVLQLTNLPVDVKIEKWIYDKYPGLRNEQENSLKIVTENTLESVSKKIEKATVRKIFFLSNAMGYAYLKATDSLIGADSYKKYRSHRDIIEAGEHLYKLLRIGDDDEGFDQDIQTIKEWADYLEIGDWFFWLAFEDMPDNYYR